MIQSILLGVALTAAAASAETATISECTTNFDNGAETADPASTEFCSLLQNFAACLALAPVGGSTQRAGAELILLTLQQENQRCTNDDPTNPTMEVVNRQLRFTAENDVIFRRYRGEEISIFDIKGLLEKKAELAAVEELAVSFEQNKAASTDALKVAVDTLDGKFTEMQTEMQTGALADVVLQVKTVEAKAEILDAKIDAVKAEVIEANNAAYWLHTSPSILPLNEFATTVLIAGAGLEQYYSPFYKPMFTCTFTPPTGDAILTDGVVSKMDEGFAIACAGPPSVQKKSKFTAAVTWNTKAGKMTIPFNGLTGEDSILYAEAYLSVNLVNKRVVVDVRGLNPDQAFECRFSDTSTQTTKTFKGTVVEGTLDKTMDCGPTPTGFHVNGVTSTVTFALKNTDTNTDVLLTGKESNVIHINICEDGAKNGDETDVDCGGKCAPAFLCDAGKVCAKNSDCDNDLPCSNKKCGLDGLTPQNAGMTCKAIKKHRPDSPNGLYYVTGPNKEYASAPKRVMCWQTDRDGGGWTLGKKTWYGHRHSIPRSGQGAYGQASDGLTNRGEYYSMDDREIRTYIGNPNPNNDDWSSGTSRFNYMVDQSSFNNGHSHANREYLIGVTYTARWRFVHWQPVRESETTHIMTSYKMKGNFNGKDTQGEGEVNWRGNPQCGPNRAGGMGIICNSPRSGSPKTNPNGGHGCKFNLGKGWSGNLNFKMMETNWDTYNYVCAGAQHSSSNRFANRIWFRSGEDQKDW